jgi:PAS domain S-box-containing protein
VRLTLDAAGVITSAGGDVQGLLGYSPTELVGKPAVLIRPDPSRLVVRRKDGTTFPLDITLAPVDGGAGFIVFLRDQTGRMAIEERSYLFRSLFEAAPDAVVVVDEAGVIQIANRQVETLFGYAPGELVGQQVDVLVPERIRSLHPFHRAKYVHEPRTRPMGVGLELSARRKDGTEFPVDISLSAIETPDGLLVSAAVRDITERKRAEARQRLYQALLEAAPDAIVVVDAAGRIRLVNSQVEKLFGYTRSELIGQPVEMLVPERVRRQHPMHRAAYVHDPRTRPMGAGLELSARRKDGTEFPVDISLSAIETDEGLLVSAALRDVTDLRRVEERNRLAAIVDNSVDAIIGKTLDGTITSWNPAAEKLYGWTAAEAIGRDIGIIYPPDRMHERASVLDRLRKGERIPSFQTVRVRRDRSRLDQLVSISPVRDQQGRIVGAAAISTDVTEQVVAASQRERLERELQQAQRLESVGQLAGGIAHDFNNLIAVIINYATFAADELQDRPSIRDDVEEIRRAAERAAALTRQLLIFSRREVTHPERLDLNSVVGDMRKLLQRTIGEHIDLVTHTADDLWEVVADRGQIEQVVMNLAVNARDAMAQGGRLVIETENVELDEDFAAGYVNLKPGRYVRLSVADSGHGMTKEVADHAFEPFFTTKPKGQGTGLGLATVHGIVSHSGGHVTIYSEPERGTTLRIHLPAAEGAKAAAAAKAGLAGAAGSGETVLLVEDETAVRSAARRILAQAGYQVIEAASPMSALALGEDAARRIDLVLSDVVMPEMSGLEMAARLREKRPGLRVLYMSGYPQDVIAHQGLVVGDVPLLEKPFTRDRLLRGVRETLSGGGS